MREETKGRWGHNHLSTCGIRTHAENHPIETDSAAKSGLGVVVGWVWIVVLAVCVSHQALYKLYNLLMYQTSPHDRIQSHLCKANDYC